MYKDQGRATALYSPALPAALLRSVFGAARMAGEHKAASGRRTPKGLFRHPRFAALYRLFSLTPPGARAPALVSSP